VLESETPEAFEIGISYFCGALAHYTLDTAIHPYVNARIGLDPEAEYSKKKKMPLHHRLESAIDAKMIAVKKNILPSAYVPSKETALTGEERSALAALLSKAVSKAYYVRLREENVTASLWMMRVLADSFYYHPESRKKHFEKVEWIFTEDYFYSNLLIADSYIRKKKIMNTENMPWHNPSDPSVQSTFSVWEIYDHAVQQYAVYLSALKPLRKRYRSRWLMLRQPYYFVQEKRERTKKGAHLQQIRRLEHEKISLEKMQKEIAGAVKQLGNLSYNTGLPLS
ncbi:MAG: hypothetical protein LUH14_11275, partial [Clostridiaceae bacterium]|nr:hypothetical protein [Clostridiaceae bacterium]